MGPQEQRGPEQSGSPHLSPLSVAMTTDQEQFGEESIYLAYTSHHSPPFREVMAGTQRQELKQR